MHSVLHKPQKRGVSGVPPYTYYIYKEVFWSEYRLYACIFHFVSSMKVRGMSVFGQIESGFRLIGLFLAAQNKL